MLSGENIFQIDFHAELRKLIAQRFKSKGDYLAELVRLAARGGPSRIDVKVSRARVIVRHDGAPLESRLFNYLYAVFDPNLDNYLRHRSLASLEAHFGLEILAAFSRQRSKIVIDTPTRAVVFCPGRAPKERAPRVSAGFRIVIKGSNRKRADEKKAVENQCRYAPLPIFLNGRQVSFGMEIGGAILASLVVEETLHGQVALPGEGDLCRIVRLKNGVEFDKSYRSCKDGMVFHAVIEDSSETFSDTWHALTPVAGKLYAQMSKEYGEASPSTQKRMLQLLFEYARVTTDVSLLEGLKVFELTNRAELDLKGVARLAASGPLIAIDKDKENGSLEFEGRSVLMLDRQQRQFLTNQGFELDAPPPRSRNPFGGARLRAWRYRRRVKRLLPSQQLPGTPVDSAKLSGKEHAFISAVGEELKSGAFLLCAEDTTSSNIRFVMARNQQAFLARVEGPSDTVEYRLARSHRFTRALVKKVRQSPAYLYPALQFMALGAVGYTSPAPTVQKHLVIPV